MWYDNEVVSFAGDEVRPAQTTTASTHGLRSVAVRLDDSLPWIWLDVMEDTFKATFTIDPDLEKSFDCEHSSLLSDVQAIAVYHQHVSGDKLSVWLSASDLPDDSKPMYLQTQEYWQLRDSKSQCINTASGWDGTPEELQSMFCSHDFEKATWLCDYLDAKNQQEDDCSTTASFQSWATTTTSWKKDELSFQSSSEEEGSDGCPNLTRAEKRALKR